MKRIFLTIMLVFTFSSISFAELGFNGVAAQAGLVLPLETNWTAGLALGAKVNMGEISDGLLLMPLFQYHKPGFDVPSGADEPSVSIIVIGADVHYAVNKQFYAGGGINYNNISLEYDVPFFGKIDASSSEIGFSALGGFNFDLGSMPAAIEARFNVVSDYNSLVATLNVFFGGK